ncbi:helicase associated domain-containing protein [Streptomyces sp. NPDC056921]|uniref:helicase associated domain-containing protein n=1 Tax=Streptomyces sp. NPDC056921 TaxID=3345966 RepID=UPI00363C27AD
MPYSRWPAADTDHAGLPRITLDREHDGDDAGNVLEDGDGAVVRVSGAAAGVLWFREERDPAVLARFVRLRVIDPEGAYWRRGIEAAGRWLRETGNGVPQVPYTVVTLQDWGAVGGYPLGQWIADQRRTYAARTLGAGRVSELEQFGWCGRSRKPPGRTRSPSPSSTPQPTATSSP